MTPTQNHSRSCRPPGSARAAARIALLAVLTVGIAVSSFAQTAPAPSEKAARAEYVRQNFDRLKARMLDLAEDLAESEPQAARAIRRAVVHAQAAFIAQDMEQVAQWLSRGLASPALGKQEEVARELRQMLRVLSGSAADLDRRTEELARIRRLQRELEKLIDRQEELERRSFRHAHADRIDRQWRQALTELAEITRIQEQLLDDTQRLEIAPAERRLGELRDAVASLLGEQEELSAAARQAPIGTLPIAGEKQQELAERARKLAGRADDDTELPSPSDGAGADLSAAGGSMQVAAENLRASQTDSAESAQRQAEAHLRKALAALDALLGRGGEAPAEAIVKAQRSLAERTAALARSAADVLEQSGQDTPSARGLLDAAAEMGQAAARDTDAARANQRRALEELTRRAPELAQLHRRTVAEARQPLDAQQAEQEQLARDTAATAGQMTTPEGEPTAGSEPAHGAAAAQQRAAGSLDRGDSDTANQEQREALDQLRRALRELSEQVAMEQELLQAERLARMDRTLDAILRRQEGLSERTRELAASDRADDRPAALEAAELSRSQAELAEQVERARQRLLDEGGTVVFPVVLAQVRTDMQQAGGRLADRRPGERTQRLQADAEQRLGEMIDAIRKELAERRKPPPGGGGGGGGAGQPGGRRPLVPPVAELKLLRALQLVINRRTVEIDRARSSGDLPPDQAASQLTELARRQAELRDMAGQLAEQTRRARPTDNGPAGP